MVLKWKAYRAVINGKNGDRHGVCEYMKYGDERREKMWKMK